MPQKSRQPKETIEGLKKELRQAKRELTRMRRFTGTLMTTPMVDGMGEPVRIGESHKLVRMDPITDHIAYRM